MRKLTATGMFVAVCALVALSCGVQEAKGPKKKSKKSKSEVVGVVDGHEITLEEVDRMARQVSLEPYTALYNARKMALDALITNRLLDEESEKRGLSNEELINAEVKSKLTPITDADIKTFYESRQQQLRGRPLEELQGQIRSFLTAQQEKSTMDAFIARLKADRSIRLSLDVPRHDITIGDHEPSKGPSDAPIQIVEYSEFQCPYCSRVMPTLKQVMDAYPGRVRVVFRDFPLAFHNNAQIASEAAQCAHSQGKFWDYHDKLFANQSQLDADSLKAYAAELGLDTAEFDACLDSGEFRELVGENHSVGTSLGVSGTPAFFINGRFLNGAVPFEQFKKIIDEELELQ